MYCALVLAVAFVAGANAYSSGAPDFTPDPRNPMSMMQEMMDARCTTGNLRPKHSLRGSLIMPQTGAAPYSLTVDNANIRYQPGGQKIRVTLHANAGKTFKGFFISGDGEDSKGFEGNFEADASNRGAAKSVKSCVQGATHTASTPKTQVTVLWTPPANFTYGRVQFKATVVESFDRFWTGVLSNTIDAAPGFPSQTAFTEQKAREMQQQLQRMMGGQGGGMGGMNLGDMMKNFRNMMPGGGGQQQQAQNPMAGMGNPFANMQNMFGQG